MIGPGRTRRSPGPVLTLRSWLFNHAQCALSSLGVLWRSPVGTALTAAVIGVALGLPAAAYMTVGSVLDVSARFSHTGEISAFLYRNVNDERGAALAREVATEPGVSNVRLISRHDALEEFRAAAGVGYGLESLGEVNPLPAVLAVTPASRSAADAHALSTRLAELPEVEFVQADGDWLRRLEAIVDLARRGLWLLAAFLGGGIVLVVGNTLRLSIEARRSEVEVAKLFGASDAFVRRPFLYQGLLYGLAGALVACVLLLIASALLAPAVDRLAELYAGPGSGTAGTSLAQVLAALLPLGAGLGLAGAWFCVGYHLRRVEPR